MNHRSDCPTKFNNPICTCPKLILDEEELKALDDYFCNRAGYISREFDDAIHTIIGKINRVLRNPL